MTYLLVIQLVTSLQKPYYRLRARWSPTAPHHKTITPIHRCPPSYPILLLFSICFCGIRQYFVHILIVSARGGATALNRISHKTIFCTCHLCVRSWNNYSLKQDFPWQKIVSVWLCSSNVFLFNKIINMFRVGITSQPLFFIPLKRKLVSLCFYYDYYVFLEKRLWW